MSIRREIGAIISKLHRIDLGKPIDLNSGLGGANFYIQDLAEKLSFVKAEILSTYNLDGTSRTWYAFARTYPLMQSQI